MNKQTLIKLLEFSTLILILSYFFVNNIFLVLVGIILSLYLLNNNFINSLPRSINLTSTKGRVYEKNKEKDKVIEIKSKKENVINELSRLTLAETIEELGFIPSPDKNEDSNVA